MKTIKMEELKNGDVFTHALKLINREAFVVEQVNEKTILCVSRSTGRATKKSIKGTVIYLRNIGN